MGQPRRTNHDAPRPSLQVRLERDLETALRLEVVLIHAAWTVREVLGGRATDRLLVARLDRDDRKAVQEVVDTKAEFEIGRRAKIAQIEAAGEVHIVVGANSVEGSQIT